jgi:hypothetical protein
MGSPETASNGNTSAPVTRKQNSVLIALLKFIETCYGLFILAYFAVQMFLANKRFRVMDSIDKKELADGNYCLVQPQLVIMVTNDAQPEIDCGIYRNALSGYFIAFVN